MKETIKHYGKIFLNLSITLLLAALAIFAVPKVLLFFIPFVIGGIIAWVSNPLVGFFERKIKIRRKAMSVALIVLVIGLVSFLIYGTITFLVREVSGFLETLPNAWAAVEATVVSVGNKANKLYVNLPLEVRNSIETFFTSLNTDIGKFISKISEPTVSAVSNFAMNLPSFIVGTIMCFMSAYFFIVDRNEIHLFIRKVTPKFIMQKWNIVYTSLSQALGGYIKAQFKIEARIFVLIFAGLLVLRVKYAVLIALIIAFVDILPVFGMGAILLPWSIIEFLREDYVTAIGLCALWGIGNIVRQIIQPKIVGDTVGLDTLPTLFLIYIGWKFGGMVGMILAVPLGILLVNLMKAGVFDSLVESVRILGLDIGAFRTYTKKDKEYYKHYLDENDRINTEERVREGNKKKEQNKN